MTESVLNLAEIDPAWAKSLAPVQQELQTVQRFLVSETKEGRPYLPAAQNVLRAFKDPQANIKVLIVGQDPYPTPGHAIGLSFAVDRDVRPLPRSLQNIYRELHDDLGITPAKHGDLSAWSKQGVMLLNRVLTVEEGKAGSHTGKGWEAITECAIKALAEKAHAAPPQPLVAVLWGNQARTLRGLLEGVAIVESAHPSPLSARRGFFGSRPFSRVNQLLAEQGAESIEWNLDYD